MKGFITWIFSLVALFTVQGVMQAQYDDLYFDPDSDYEYVYGSDQETIYNEDAAYYGQGDYDNEYYESEDRYYEDDYDYYDDYGYHYSSRIRRFHRPAAGFGFYDPFYTNMMFYNGFGPGVSIYFTNMNTFGYWNRWNRWNRWRPWGFNSPFGFNNPWGAGFYDPWYGYTYNTFYDPFFGPTVINNAFFFGGNAGFFNPYYTNFGCPPYGGGLFVSNNGGGVVGDTRGYYYGPRRIGSSTFGGDGAPRRSVTTNEQVRQALNPDRNSGGIAKTFNDRARVRDADSDAINRGESPGRTTGKISPGSGWTMGDDYQPRTNTRPSDGIDNRTPRTRDSYNRPNTSPSRNDGRVDRSTPSSRPNKTYRRPSSKPDNTPRTRSNRSSRNNNSGYNRSSSPSRSNSGWNRSGSSRSSSGYSPSRSRSGSSGSMRSGSSSRSSSGSSRSSSGRSSSPRRR